MSGQLLYAVVARGSIILSEHTAPTSSTSHITSNISQAAQAILSKVAPNDSKLTYSSEFLLFHYIKQDGVVVLVASNDEAGRRTPFAFLVELQKRFLTAYTKVQIDDAPAYGMNSFSKEIAALMDYFEKSPPSDPLKQAQADLADVKNIMAKNVETILSRGERLDLLIDKTDHMSTQARQFRKRAVVMRRKMWWKNTKLMALTGMSVVLLIYLFVASSCGPFLNNC